LHQPFLLELLALSVVEHITSLDSNLVFLSGNLDSLQLTAVVPSQLVVVRVDICSRQILHNLQTVYELTLHLYVSLLVSTSIFWCFPGAHSSLGVLKPYVVYVKIIPFTEVDKHLNFQISPSHSMSSRNV
jgi:hypothetical protein